MAIGERCLAEFYVFRFHLSISLRAPVPDVAHSVYAFAYATQGDTVAIDEPRIEMGGAGTVVLVTIVTE